MAILVNVDCIDNQYVEEKIQENASLMGQCSIQGNAIVS